MAALDAQLNYIGDASGIVPIVDGNELTWNLPTDLSFLGSGQFSLRISAPASPYGSLYPIKLGISSDGPEGAHFDNTTSVSIMIARQIYLPSILRNYRE